MTDDHERATQSMITGVTIMTSNASKSGPVSGDAFLVSATWRAAVKAELSRREWTLTRLHTEVGVSVQALSWLLKHGRRSALVSRINEIFGWPPPGTDSASSPAPVDPSVELLATFSQLSDVNKGRALERVAELLRAQKTPT